MRDFTELTALLFIFKVKDHSILQQLDLNTKIKMLLSPIENHCKKKKEYASALKIMHLDKFNVTYIFIPYFHLEKLAFCEFQALKNKGLIM